MNGQHKPTSKTGYEDQTVTRMKQAVVDLGDPIELGLNVSAQAPAQHTSVSV